MEPTNHPFRKEIDLPKPSMIMVHVNLPGVLTKCLGDWIPPPPRPGDFECHECPAGWTSYGVAGAGRWARAG